MSPYPPLHCSFNCALSITQLLAAGSSTVKVEKQSTLQALQTAVTKSQRTFCKHPRCGKVMASITNHEKRCIGDGPGNMRTEAHVCKTTQWKFTVGAPYRMTVIFEVGAPKLRMDGYYSRHRKDMQWLLLAPLGQAIHNALSDLPGPHLPHANIGLESGTAKKAARFLYMLNGQAEKVDEEVCRMHFQINCFDKRMAAKCKSLAMDVSAASDLSVALQFPQIEIEGAHIPFNACSGIIHLPESDEPVCFANPACFQPYGSCSIDCQSEVAKRDETNSRPEEAMNLL